MALYSRGRAYPKSPGKSLWRATRRPGAYRVAAALALGLAGWAPLLFAAGEAEGPVVTRYELRVTFADKAELDALAARGFSVDQVTGDSAQVYATEAQRAELKALGWDYTLVEARTHAERPYDPAEAAALKGASVLGAYPSYAELTQALEAYAAAHPDIARLSSIGLSREGRALWVLRITDNPDLEEDEPEFKYVATMHGDEPVGMALCLYLIDRLLNEYDTDARIANLVDATDISILPLMNPDGNAVPWRGNALGFDLNRSFPLWPEQITGTIFDGALLGDAGRQPEVGAVMRWVVANSFILSANYHGGALVTNYPYDDDELGSVDSPTPDDLLFESIALAYASANAPMYNSAEFAQGIVNGAAWYSIDGGMQDWNYRYAACNEVTIEVSNVKYPAASTLPQFWAENEESMLAYLEQVHIGVRGMVQSAATGAPLYARIAVAGNGQPAFTDPGVGDYHRMLLPGAYALTCEAEGYFASAPVAVNVLSGTATVQHFRLVPLAADTNGDSAVNALDIQIVINAALGIDIGALSADINGDSVVNALDIQLVINAALVV